MVGNNTKVNDYTFTGIKEARGFYQPDSVAAIAMKATLFKKGRDYTKN